MTSAAPATAAPSGRVEVVPLSVILPVALDTISENQTYAFVGPTAHFTGAMPADDDAIGSPDGAALARAIMLPLDAFGWRLAAPERATFHVSVLVAVRGQCRFRGFVIERTRDRARLWRLYSATRMSHEATLEQFTDDVLGLIAGEAIPFPDPPPRQEFCPRSFQANLRHQRPTVTGPTRGEPKRRAGEGGSPRPYGGDPPPPREPPPPRQPR